MAFDVDTSVSCRCTGCRGHIDQDDNIYCESCYSSAAEDAVDSTVRVDECRGCSKSFPRTQMIEKVEGIRCSKCAAKLEAELLAKRTEPQSAQAVTA